MVNAVRLPSSVGSDPVKLLFIARNLNAVRLPSSVGIGPVGVGGDW